MPSLDAPQRALLDRWLGEWEFAEDLSQPFDIATWRVRTASRDVVVKASATSHHIVREIDAYEFLAGRLGESAPRYLHGDRERRILVIEFLEGELAEGTPWEWDAAIYEQAGAVLAKLQVPGRSSDDYMAGLIAKTSGALDGAAHLIPPAHRAEIRGRLAAISPRPVRLSFTHGDWHARNWLVHEGRLRVFDLGRGAQRHWTHDLARVESKHFARKPELRLPFYRGLGREPEGLDAECYALEEMCQAVTTVPWAHGFGDTAFEDFGREMIRRIVER